MAALKPLAALGKGNVAAILPDFDTEVLEIHHRTKVDAPSGTALALGRAIASARAQDFTANALFGREGGCSRGRRPWMARLGYPSHP